MPTLEELRPSRSWDHLLADVRRRGAIVQRRRRVARSAATLIAAVVAAAIPLAAALIDRAAPPDVPPITNVDEDRVLPPKPIVALPAAPGTRPTASQAAEAPAVLGAPPQKSLPLTVAQEQLFTDVANDVRSDAGLKVSEPAIDLRRGDVSYLGDEMTFELTFADLAAPKGSDLCQTYDVTLAYRGVELRFLAQRGAAVCNPGFAFVILQGQDSFNVAVAGRFDDAADSIVGTISLAELNAKLPAQVPPVGSTTAFDGVSASSRVYKKITEGTASLSDPRNATDEATG